MSGKHYLCRLVKRLDGKEVVTWPKLGSMYPHGQKTLKNSNTLEGAIAEAKKFNIDLPPEVIGLVVAEYPAKVDNRLYTTSSHKLTFRHSMRPVGKTEWKVFINRNSETFELDSKHMILGKV